MDHLLSLSRHVDSLKSSSTIKCSRRVICQLVLESCWRNFLINIASIKLYNVSLCDAVNCFAEVQYKSPTVLRHSRKAGLILLGGQNV